MSHPYTPANVALTPYLLPDDGDEPVKAADVNVPLAALGDGIENLRVTKAGINTPNPFTGPVGFHNTVAFLGPWVQFTLGTALRLPVVVDLADVASQTVGPEDGLIFRFPSSVAPVREVFLRQTSGDPLVGGEIMIFAFNLTGVEGSEQWRLRREGVVGSQRICHFDNAPYSPDAGSTFAVCQYDGTNWRYLFGAGCAFPGDHR